MIRESEIFLTSMCKNLTWLYGHKEYWCVRNDYTVCYPLKLPRVGSNTFSYSFLAILKVHWMSDSSFIESGYILQSSKISLLPLYRLPPFCFPFFGYVYCFSFRLLFIFFLFFFNNIGNGRFLLKTLCARVQ